MNAIAKLPTPTGHEFRQSTDAAGLCGAIVQQTASSIQGRRYVSVEGWQAIAIAHGCAAGARDVEKIDGGVRAIGEVRRMDDGQIISVAEGFVGEDEPTWYGGKNKWGKEQPKRLDYAIRAMAQTRAISRACRSAFAHVVVMIDAGLSTTPAEEVPEGGFGGGQFEDERSAPAKVVTIVQREEPQEPHTGEPAPNHKGWREPDSIYSTPSKLHKGVTSLERELMGCGDSDMIYGVTAMPEWTEFVRIAEMHAPHYLRGGEPAPPEFEGLLNTAERMVREFDTATANHITDLARA